MRNTLQTSDSLISSLCREVDQLRFRYTSIVNSLDCCHDKNLKKRLSQELFLLTKRQSELKNIAKSFSLKSTTLGLSTLLLLELCRRPLKVAA
ncbi:MULTISPECIES: hypothetical protein [Prochlorococcus]|uniref:hypothetical protein n=1 Tax=Prochlorococcus TaxID=1218 RepID=UPI00053384ED|nr:MULTISPECIES: hypothetical protein [Prochlorococcus]KGG12392.1 hypothetical protein EV05_1604 [Prochlorococcus sp. MIT 0601]